MIDASQPPIRLLLHVPKDSFTPPEGKDLYDRVIPLLEKAGEIAKDTGRAYVYPCHLALAVLSDGIFSRPEKPVNFAARIQLYLSDLLEKDGHSLAALRRILWRNAVRSSIQAGYDSDTILYSTDLVSFLRKFCISKKCQEVGDLYLNYFLKHLIQDGSLSAAMEASSLSVEEIVKMIDTLNKPWLPEYYMANGWVEDLTAAEEAAKSPIFGRCDEVDRIIHILLCRTKNMPLLVGKPGVGKSTVARILAQKILEGHVPKYLNCRVIKLTSSGRPYLTRLLGRVQSAQQCGIQLILAISNVHELDGTDIKSITHYLDTGSLLCIATTTPRHYDSVIKSFGSSDYLCDIQIAEPSIPDTINILRTLTANLITYHGGDICVEDAALHQAVNLAKRFLSSMWALPKSAVQVLDQACALVRAQRSEASKSWVRAQSRKVALKIEVTALENATDSISQVRHLEASSELTGIEEQCSSFEDSLVIEYERERLCHKLKALHKEACDAQKKGNRFLEHDIRYGPIADLEDQCVKMPSPRTVTADIVAKALSDATGFPVEKLKSTDQDKVLNLDVVLAKEVVGQPEATQAVANAIQLAYSGLTDPCRPMASFLLVGPTGTGKTLLAKTLANTLFDSPEAMIRIDASEYAERHSIARLIGSPPGYVGYNSGGQLTNHVRKNPYTIVLVDEIEKAALQFVMIFLQVLDDGRLTDGQGETVDFRNTVIIMTSNLGSRHMTDACSAEEDIPSAIRLLVTASIQSHFPPEFINRIDEIIFYRPLSRDNIRAIVENRLKEYSNRLTSRKIRLLLDDCAKDHLAEVGYSPIYGARPLNRVMRERILNPLAKIILRGDVADGGTVTIRFDAESCTLLLEPSTTDIL